MKSLAKISFFIYICVTGLASCSVDNNIVDHPLKPTTSPAFDTLQGSWLHSTTTLHPVGGSTSGSFTAVNTGYLRFNSDLTGTDQFLITPVSFTYTLLPGDTTLIFNNNPQGVPVFDTAIIRM